MSLRIRSVGLVGALLGALGLLDACARPAFVPESDGIDVEPAPGAAAVRVPVQAEPLDASPDEPLDASETTAGPGERLPFGTRLMVTSDEIAERLHLASPKGLFVIEVERGGAAFLAGIRAGDVVLTFAGMPVNTEQEIKAALAPVRPKDIELVGIWRDGAQRLLVVEF